MVEQSAAVREFADVDAEGFEAEIDAAGCAPARCTARVANRTVMADERRAESAAMR